MEDPKVSMYSLRSQLCQKILRNICKKSRLIEEYSAHMGGRDLLDKQIALQDMDKVKEMAMAIIHLDD